MMKYILILFLTISAFAQRTQQFNADKYQFGASLPTLLGSEIGVFKYADFSSFPMTGVDGAIYLDKDTNKLYRWDSVGTEYDAISGGGLADWITANDYKIGDVVIESQAIYQANADHTSGTFATDIANWTPIGIKGPASSTDNAIARYDGTNGKIIQNSSASINDTGDVTANSFSASSTATTSSFSGLQINNRQITAVTGGNLDLHTTDSNATINLKRKTAFQGKKLHSSYNDPTSGSNATLEDHTTAHVRLTASGNLVSIDGIPAGNGGDLRTIVNLTGASVTINNETGGTAANRILTGTGGNLKIKNNGSVQVQYDLTQQRWYVIGGVGGSSGLGGTDIMFVQDFEGAVSGDFATLTGWALSLSSPLHGDVDLKVTHAASVTTYSVKQSITVPAKFKGKNMTVKLTAKSSATGDNVVLDLGCSTDTDILNGDLVQFDSGTGGEESYHSFDLPGSCATLSYTVRALPETGPPSSSIDDIEFYLTLSEDVHTSLVQEYDSEYRVIAYAAAMGSTGNRTWTFSGGNATQRGDGVTYIVDAVNGDRWLINKDAFCSLNVHMDFASTNQILAWSKNASSTTTASGSMQSTEILSKGFQIDTAQTNWAGPLKSGDIIRLHANSSTSASSNDYQSLSVSCAGSLRQSVINKNQKIKIPSSELRLEGSNARGGTATAIVKFDTIAKTKGDAFLVVNTSADGTYVQMTKSGWVSMNSTLNFSSAADILLSKNQATLTAVPTLSESLHHHTGDPGVVTWTGQVNTGDILRVSTGANPATGTYNQWNLWFQEQEVQVSVSNTLPQFTESDSAIRLDTAAGNGSTATKVRRFTNLRQSVGTDVTYTSSSVNGDSFTINKPGLYHISYSDSSNGAAADYAITKNASSLTTDPASMTISQILAIDTSANSNYTANASTVAYLDANDIIRAQASSTGVSSGSYGTFSISKVGKPNVKGVDVTPFTNYESIETEYMRFSGHSGFSGSNTLFTNTLANTAKGIIRYNSSTGVFTALRKCKATISWSNIQGTGGGDSDIIYNSGSVSRSDTAANSYGEAFGWTGVLEVNDTISFQPQFAPSTQHMSFTCDAISTQIVTPVESFSTETATLAWSNSACTSASTPGCYNTYSYTINSNTKALCTSTNRPTQTDVAMNTDGMFVTARPYNAASTCALPARFEIFVGKGFRGYSPQIFKSAGKVTAGSLDWSMVGNATDYGCSNSSYDSSSGFVTIDCAYKDSSSNTASVIHYSDNSNTSNGYLVLNLSKTPTLSGISYAAPRVAWLTDVKSSGTHGGTCTSGSFFARTLNTEDDPSDFVTLSSNQFTLPAGEYIIEAYAPHYFSGANKTKIRNTTDGSDTLIGINSYGGSAAETQPLATLNGRFTITASKTFELQQRCTTTRATDGLGVAASFSISEIYGTVKITKVR